MASGQAYGNYSNTGTLRITSVAHVLRGVNQGLLPVTCSRVQFRTNSLFDSNRNEHDVWRALITPSCEVRSILETEWYPCALHKAAPCMNFFFCTLVPRRPLLREPARPPGLSSASECSTDRWRADARAQPLRHYETPNLVDHPKSFARRRLIAVEEERLWGFKAHITAPLIHTNDFKNRPDVRTAGGTYLASRGTSPSPAS
jgi:hypothetical protein